jgi:hypothetical protein
MAAVRVLKQIDSETVHLPELRPFLGKLVEIVVTETPEDRRGTSVYDSFFDLAGEDAVDPEAYKKLRAASMT